MSNPKRYNPYVSVIVPCRNEEEFIGQCLNSLIANDYPKEKLEILVLDGISEDKTREVIKKYIDQHSFIKLINNPQKFLPNALNIGIKKAKGKIIIRADAHSVYDKEYISKSVRYLKKYKADNVGGIWKMIPRNDNLIGKVITFVLSSPFSSGVSYYRSNLPKKVKLTNTVPFGCFKKETFEKIGPFDERIEISEDIDFNLRLRKIGGKILLAPDIVSHYYVRTSLRGFLKHTLRNGIWVTYPLIYGKVLFTWRHLIPLLFVVSLICLAVFAIFSPIFLWLFLLVIGLYLFLNLYYSLEIALREKSFKYLILLPIIFTAFHVIYGLGSVWGLILILKR